MIALHGKETGAGDFLVEDILEAGLPHQIERPLNSGRIQPQIFMNSSQKANNNDKQD